MSLRLGHLDVVDFFLLGNFLRKFLLDCTIEFVTTIKLVLLLDMFRFLFVFLLKGVVIISHVFFFRFFVS